jgi:hypothetical protein
MKSICPGLSRVGLLSFSCLNLFFVGASAPAGTVDLWQARNGTAAASKDPVEWVKGNAGPANAHYAEGHSIAYRIVLTGVSPGYHKVVIEWDTKQNGRHAIDYLSHYQRLQPHTYFGEHMSPESVNPLTGLAGEFGVPATFGIPAPSSGGSPVTNQPAQSFASLAANERVITMWNGTITNLSYASQGDLSADSSASQLSMEFLATKSTVVIAWGGHIASRLDWGADNSAAGINGSPYHTRLISIDGSGGNQDRSVQAQAIVSPPACSIGGPTEVCPGTTNAHLAITDLANAIYGWSLVNNAHGAIIVGNTNGSSVQVVAGQGESYTLQVRISAGGGQSVCATEVTVTAPTTASLLADQIACPGATVVFSTVPGGAGPWNFIWRKDGQLLEGATNASIMLPPVTLEEGGFYCVEVTGACNALTNCATLTVVPPPRITCPPAMTVECVADVPAPNPAGVSASSDFVEVSVMHVADNAVTNGCEITISRRYRATDACGSSSFCEQLIRVHDTVPPAIACAPDRVVEWGAEWGFDKPSANDGCTENVPIAILETITNQLAGPLFSAIRTWQATDNCSNFAICRQRITLQDTTPPQIVCPSNITVVGSGRPGTEILFVGTAVDRCDTNVTLVCVPRSGSIFPLGVTIVNCEAVDFSANRSECSFTVTVRDDESPQMICPANMIVAETPAGSGHATVSYPAPVVTDNFDADPIITCTPEAGTSLPVGDNVIACTARDSSGNMAACSFTIRVVPETITADNTADAGPGTLRQALLDANAVAGTNVIQFAFPGAPPHVVHLLSPFPEITDAVVIDGWSQPGFMGNPIIEITGTSATGAETAAGLAITAGNCVARGLSINGFGMGIALEGDGGNVIQGNFIGTDTTGVSARGNFGDGIYVASAGNVIGGSTAQARNVISANEGSGLVFDSFNATENTVQGNFVGAGSDGTADLGNRGNGIVLRSGAAHNMIGPGNVIAHNAGTGILLEASAGTGNAIRGNAIGINGGLGIDVNGDGMTDNDEGDRDDGPNNAQNFPVLSRARTLAGVTTIDGTLNSSSNATYQLDFYLNPVFGAGRGEVFLGSAILHVGSNAMAPFSITLSLAVAPDQFISATATDADNNTSEFSLPIRVGSPPFIVGQPAGTNVTLGTTAMFCVNAQGSAPLLFQWRQNGANIPGATNACHTISNVKLSDGGSYTVVVANEFDAILSGEAFLTFDLPAVPAGDNFAQRVALAQRDGIAAGDNILATREPGEPNHAGKPGGKSVWYTWIAPETGIGRFRTVGSTFDTLLAVYEGSAIANLDPVNGDEDGGGFFTSDLEFNAYAGIEYQIVIDGFGAEGGIFVFDWQFENTGHLLPVIVTHPLNQTVAPGTSCSFSVLAIAGCTDGHYDCRHPKPADEVGHGEHNARLTYQWFLNGTPLPGETNTSLTISGVEEIDLGDYWVQVRDRDRTIESKAATLQINLSGGIAQDVQAFDKFLDAVNSGALAIGELTQTTAGASQHPELPAVAAAGTVVSGFTGTQVFNTSTNTTSRLESICGVIGGASAWLSIVPTTNGVLFVNTYGSSYDTVLAVFIRSPTNASTLQLRECNNNDSTNLTSALSVPAIAGQTNFVLVDGVNGTRGTLKLNYSLVTPATLVPMGVAGEGAYRFQIIGRPGMRFTIQRCATFGNWLPILTTTSETAVFEFTDTDSTPSDGRFYRVLMLP